MQQYAEFPHGLEKGKRWGYFAYSHQYRNAPLKEFANKEEEVCSCSM